MTIGEIVKYKDIYTYHKLINMFKKKRVKKEEKKQSNPKRTKLGCSVEELMRSDSYCREGRRIKQRSWGR